MLRHVVLMRYPAGTDPAVIDAMDIAARRLADAIPDISHLSAGADTSGQPEAFDYALILDFQDRHAYERYRAHPAHRAFIAEHMKGHAIEKARVQYNLGSEA